MGTFEITPTEIARARADAKLKVASGRFPGTKEDDNFAGSCGETAFARWLTRAAVISSGPCPPLKTGTADFYAGRRMPKLGVDVKTHATTLIHEGVCTYDVVQSAKFGAKGIDLVVWAELRSKEWGAVSWLTNFTPPIRATLIGWSWAKDVLAEKPVWLYGKNMHVVGRHSLRTLTALEQELKRSSNNSLRMAHAADNHRLR